MALPGDVNINAFRARLIELKAALATISKFAAKEMIISKNSTSKARAVSKKTKQISKKNVSKTAVSQKANDRKKNKGNTIHHENSAKVDILKQEVLQLKEQLSSLAEPRDIDTIERMPPSERKKMEKSADKIGMKLKAGKNKSAPTKGSRRSKTSGKRNQKSAKSSDINTVANSKKSEKANALLSKHVAAGSSTIPLDNAKGKGFKVGQKIRIGNDQFSEERFIIGFGSIILDRPLEFPHVLGEPILVVKATAKELKQFHHRGIRLFITAKVIDVIIAKAAALGEKIVVGRAKQREFEARSLQKPLFCTLNVFNYNLGKSLVNPKLVGLTSTGKLVLGSSSANMQYFNEGFSISDLKAIFNKLDKDGDGTVDRQELLEALSGDDGNHSSSDIKPKKCKKQVDITRAVASAMLSSAAADADQDDDGILTWEEFLGFFLPQVARHGLPPAPQGFWRNSDWAVGLSESRIKSYWEVFNQEMSPITQEAPLTKVPGMCWELTSGKSRNDANKRFVIDTKVVHQWAVDEGIINEDTQMPTISFPDFIRFKIEYDPDNLEDYDSKNEASRMNDLKNAVNMFRRPPSPFIQSGEGTKIFEVIAGTENGYDDKIFVLTNRGELEVWNTKSDSIDYRMQILQPFGLNNITNVKKKRQLQSLVST